MKQNLLMVQLSSIYGGAEIYCSRLSHLLSEKLKLFHFVGSPKLHNYLIEQNKTAYQTRFIGNLYYLINLFKIISIIKRHKIDTVHLNGEPELLCAPILNFFCRIIVTIHTDILHEPKRDESWWRRIGLRQKIKNTILIAALRCCDRLVCVSTNMVNDLKQYPFLQNKTLCIPNWPPEKYLTLKRVKKKETNNKFHLLLVSRLIKAKGHIDLFKACQGIENLTVHLVGDGPDRALFEKKTKGLNITFHGFQEDPLPFYLMSDAVILPSHSEGNPLSLLEGMALGLPCIGSDLPATREIITNKKDGLLFSTGDPNDLRQAILLLMNNKKLRESLGNAAREKILAKFSSNTACKKYLDCFSLL